MVEPSAASGGRDGKSRASVSPSALTRSGPLFERKWTSVRPFSISLKTTQAAARVACPQRSTSSVGVIQRIWK